MYKIRVLLVNLGNKKEGMSNVLSLFNSTITSKQFYPKEIRTVKTCEIVIPLFHQIQMNC
jgi:hypothetical protein